jgi:hypothetical protein
MLAQLFDWSVLALFSIGFVMHLYPLVMGRSIKDAVPATDPSTSVVRVRGLLWMSVCLWLVAKSVHRLFPVGPDAVLTHVLLGAVAVAWVGIAVGVMAWVRHRLVAVRGANRPT